MPHEVPKDLVIDNVDGKDPDHASISSQPSFKLLLQVASAALTAKEARDK